jgi:hypothetical protein
LQRFAAARLDAGHWITIWRPRTCASDGRRRTQAGGGERRRTRRREPQSRVSGHGLGRGGRLGAACEHAEQAGPTTEAEMRRSGGSTRRRGARTPATALGRRGARDRQQATPTGSPPPCAAPGRFLGGGRTTAAGFDGGGGELETAARLGFRQGAAQEARAARVGGSREAVAA